MRVIKDHLGQFQVRRLRPEQAASFVSDLVDAYSPSRARNIRSLLVQVLDEAVTVGLAEENVAKRTRPPRVARVQRRTLTPAEIARLLHACDERFVAAVALCFVHGWRVSEALGLGWDDVDLEQRTVIVRRAATYLDGTGMVLGPTKTVRTAGRHLLGPTVVELLLAHRSRQTADRAQIGAAWPEYSYEGQAVDLVFTTTAGSPMLRQHVDRAIRRAALDAGLDPTQLGTHAGRRSVVTNLYASGSLDLSDVASFVGHSDVATTRGYVQHEGDRPLLVSQRALEYLDPPQTND